MPARESTSAIIGIIVKVITGLVYVHFFTAGLYYLGSYQSMLGLVAGVTGILIPVLWHHERQDARRKIDKH
jgi:hypothetical protein